MDLCFIHRKLTVTKIESVDYLLDYNMVWKQPCVLLELYYIRSHEEYHERTELLPNPKVRYEKKLLLLYFKVA